MLNRDDMSCRRGTDGGMEDLMSADDGERSMRHKWERGEGEYVGTNN